MSSRYDTMFARLNEKKRVAWIPFVMLGFPTLEKSYEYIELLIREGADALEIGIPFSDPVADGTVIQNAARIALEQGVTVADCLALLGRIRSNYPDTPMGLLLYANLVYKPGIEHFFKELGELGVDSALIADSPISEGARFAIPAKENNVAPVFIAPPNATEQTIRNLVELCEGYTYVVSRPGVTGNHVDVEYPLEVLSLLRELKAPPAVLGFGISQPEHVTNAVAAGFDGVISGTAVIRIMADTENDPVSALTAFSRSMSAACQKVS